jgi:cyclophilin family peptidyl-prolyl cis-trans isomerase
MSSIYSLEPPTKGKVRVCVRWASDAACARASPKHAAAIRSLNLPSLSLSIPFLSVHPQVLLHTSHGTLDVELWPKEAPLAVRNFVQLALEGAFDGSPFHRIVPGVAIQAGGPPDGHGGDPGASVYGAPFKDEFHSRLRFNRRGLVAAAGGGNANGSQFFVTLAPAPHLDRAHTIFGRLGGESVYAAAAIGEVEVGPDDAPIPPAPVIKSVEVVWNPFEDIVPRTTAAAAAAARAAAAAAAAKAAAKAARPAAATRDAKLLSFGDDEEEEDGEDGGLAALPRGRIVSAHDALGGADARLAAPGESAAAAAAEAAAAEEERAAVRARLAARAAAAAAAAASAPAKPAEKVEADAEPPPPPAARPPSPPPPPASTTDGRRAAALAKPSSTARPAVSVSSKRGRAAAAADGGLLSSWQAKRAAYAAKRAGGGAAAEDAAVARLQAFQARLRAAKAAGGGGGGGDGGGASQPPAAAVPVGRADAYRAGDLDLASLAGHRLAGPSGLGDDPLARDMDDDDGLETVDPLAAGGGGSGRRGGDGGGGGDRRRR